MSALVMVFVGCWWFVVQYQRLVLAFSGVQKYTHTFENEMNDEGFLGRNDIAARASEARRLLKAWYELHARPLPWRETPSQDVELEPLPTRNNPRP